MSRLHIGLDQILNVPLQECSDGGYLWHWTSSNPDVVEVREAAEHHALTGAIGLAEVQFVCGGQRVRKLQLKPLAAGQAVVTLTHRRPWLPTGSFDTVRFDVTVSPEAGLPSLPFQEQYGQWAALKTEEPFERYLGLDTQFYVTSLGGTWTQGND